MGGGRMEGKRTRARRRVGMIDDLKEGNSYETLKRKAQLHKTELAGGVEHHEAV